MNSNTNNKSNIQAAVAKKKVIDAVAGVAKVLKVDVPSVTYGEVDSTGGEDVAWVRIQIKKLQQIEAQLTK